MDGHEATAQLSELVDRVARGDEVVITKGGKPVVRQLRFDNLKPRRPGIAKGRLTDAFSMPLPGDELAGWDQ